MVKDNNTNTRPVDSVAPLQVIFVIVGDFEHPPPHGDGRRCGLVRCDPTVEYSLAGNVPPDLVALLIRQVIMGVFQIRQVFMGCYK